MNYYRTRTAADVLNTLKVNQDRLQDPPLFQPHWPLLERLIARKTK